MSALLGVEGVATLPTAQEAADVSERELHRK
jgi:hypothetical protein